MPGGIRDEFEDGFALPFAVKNLDEINEPRPRLRIDRQTIDDNVNRFRKIHIQQSFWRRKFVDYARLVKPIETAFLQVEQRLTKKLRLRCPTRFLPAPFRPPPPPARR